MEKCILIYDDDEEILTVTKIILEKKKYRVETRTRCDDIINEVTLIKPDIVFMDLWIPHIEGESALRLMKQNEATRQVPVMLFSANDSIEEVCKKANADGYLKKPFTIDTLLQLVDKTISEKK
ncbi:MAG TPA: response regulator [Hanamia sp.]|nr:response regulator [Hanamia sp.]